MRTRFLSVFVVLLVLVSTAFAWDEPKNFMGFVFGKEPKDLCIIPPFEEQWKRMEREGISLEEWEKRMSPDQCWEKYAQTGELGGVRKIGDIEVRVTAFLLDGKVEKVELDFPSSHFDDLRQIFSRRYGSPSSTYRVLGQTVLWRGKSVSITMKGGLVSYQTKVWAQHERRQREHERKEREKVIQKGVGDLK